MLPGITPFMWGSTGPVDIAYQTDAFANAASDTAMTFTTVAIGAAAADRYVYAAFTSEANLTVTSVTIGGIAATLAVNVKNTAHTPDLVGEIWYAIVPTGTTANIVFNFSGAVSGDMVVSTYRVTGVGQPAADTGSVTGNATSINTTVDVPAAGGVIAVALKQGTTIDTGWTGVNERTDVNAGSYAHSSGDAEVAAGETGRIIVYGGGGTGQRAMCAVAIG